MSFVTAVRLHQAADKPLIVTIEQREYAPGRRLPRLVHRPWQHYITLPPGTTPEMVFQALRVALHAIGTLPDDPPA